MPEPEAVEVTPLPDPRTSLQRVEDTAFDAQVRRLTSQRKWDELRLAFVLHGSTLSDREEGDG